MNKKVANHSKREKRKVLFGISNEVYHGKKYREYISSSKTKDIVKKGLYGTIHAPKKEAKHLDLGTAAHAYFFERDNYYNVVTAGALQISVGELRESLSRVC